MKVLYYGEYSECDTRTDCNWKQIEDAVKRNKARIGEQFGDYEVISVDYDWGYHSQVNVVRCVKCGREKSVANIADFFRGRAEGRYCSCRRESKEIPRKKQYVDYVGEVVNGFRLLYYEVERGFRAECSECGKQKWVSGKRVIEGRESCNHKKVNDYADDKYMNITVGSLTSMERVGKKYRFRCECGREIVCRPGDVFRQDGVKSCGKHDCEYHLKWLVVGGEKRKIGLSYEIECADILRNQGYEIEMTPSSGDYGVDFFAIIDGERVAFQCKRLKRGSMVSAVQEVYAGGRYYDCSKFVVVSPSGFTFPAEIMASKLGVQLERNLEGFSLRSLLENKIDTQKMTSYSGRKLMWEVDGVSKSAEEWCREYGITRTAVVSRMKRGMDLKTALTSEKYKRGII